jgi:hypothetical protein
MHPETVIFFPDWSDWELVALVVEPDVDPDPVVLDPVCDWATAPMQPNSNATDSVVYFIF